MSEQGRPTLSVIPYDPPVSHELTLMDLFAGCGGMTRGFVDAGFEPVMAIDSDVAAAATYAANFPAARVLARDIATLSDDEVAKARVVVGGPPCQGFSGLGKRDPEDVRNALWQQYKRLIHLADPDVFVIENVARFLKAPEWLELRQELDGGSLAAYEWVAGVLAAEDYGVPQRRHRAFVIASKHGKPSLPSPTRHPDGLGGMPRWATVQDAFTGLLDDPDSISLPVRRTDFEGVSVPGWYDEREIHVGRTYRAESIRRYDHIRPGQGRLSLPPELQFPCWRDRPKSTTDVLGRMRWDRPSLTVRTEFFKPEKGSYLHPRYDEARPDRRANRAITHAEAARLQSFDARHRWCGTKVAIGRQIGNAVPPTLAYEIAIQSVVPLLSADARHARKQPEQIPLPLSPEDDERLKRAS